MRNKTSNNKIIEYELKLYFVIKSAQMISILQTSNDVQPSAYILPAAMGMS